MSCQVRLLEPLSAPLLSYSLAECSIQVSFQAFSADSTHYVGSGPVVYYSLEYTATSTSKLTNFSLIFVNSSLYNSKDPKGFTFNSIFKQQFTEKILTPNKTYQFYIIPYTDLSRFYSDSNQTVIVRGLSSPASNILHIPPSCLGR